MEASSERTHFDITKIARVALEELVFLVSPVGDKYHDGINFEKVFKGQLI